ncbi:MAG: hypothetical protein H7336_09690 [Bacteriovorax sp.]|nr:hypothetical protein [Bacteriovorax sp.]
MFKLIIALTLIISSSFALAENIQCNYSMNGKAAIETGVFLVAQNTKQVFVEAADYRFFISNKANSKFELEIFDAFTPSRSYATGYLRTLEDEISWAFWSRDVLIETTCKLAN